MLASSPSPNGPSIYPSLLNPSKMASYPPLEELEVRASWLQLDRALRAICPAVCLCSPAGAHAARRPPPPRQVDKGGGAVRQPRDRGVPGGDACGAVGGCISSYDLNIVSLRPLPQKGYVEAKQFTTLRSYLAEVLHCPTMRLSKKYHGKHAIGLVRRWLLSAFKLLARG